MKDDDIQSVDIRPFAIDVAQHALSDLQHRLKNTRWTYQIEGTGWDAGTDGSYLKDLAHYWQEHFDWRAQERSLNRFEHFKTAVDGVGIHFIHARGKGSDESLEARSLILELQGGS